MSGFEPEKKKDLFLWNLGGIIFFYENFTKYIKKYKKVVFF